MEVNLSGRQNQLTQLESFLKNVDTEVTMILQSLQWDRKYLMQTKALVSCQYDTNHRVPPDKLVEHENICFLKSNGYSEKDRLLPSPVDPDAATLVKLGSDEIDDIINNAARCQALFNRGAGCSGIQPLTLDRLQATYTLDERRAIHDAVVNQVPSCHDLSDLTLMSAKDEEGKESKPKSKLEILAELRDMKRRRTKYRVAAKTRNYSDVLRDVITTQMELYTQTQENMIAQIKKEEEKEEINTSKDKSDMNREYQRDEGCSSEAGKDTKVRYGESRHSRHNKDYKSRKRRHNDEYQQNRYSRSEKSKNSKSGGEIDNEQDKETANSYASDKREDKYARRKDDKEKYKRIHKNDHDFKREHQMKQDSSSITVKNIKKEKNDLTEIKESSKYAEKTTSINKNRQSSERGSSNKPTERYDHDEQVVMIKKEVDDNDLYDSKKYETSKNYTKETIRDSSKKYNEGNKKHRKDYYDDQKGKRNRHDTERYISQEGERSVKHKEVIINERESGWSDDSENGYSQKYQRSNIHRAKPRHDKHEQKEDRHEGYKRTDCRNNVKSSHYRHSTGGYRESSGYQRDSDVYSYNKSHGKSYKGSGPEYMLEDKQLEYHKDNDDREHRNRKDKKKYDE